ncbi:hypothetical protein GQ53DRAFT_734537 [Thozetella sp. PMI_491]|nr:hypothetical protein GQ53DRAFT_734537 [Thozetella sp. PMI_491]
MIQINEPRDYSSYGNAKDDYGPRLDLTVWLLTGVAALFLGLRLYCKLWRRRPFWWDDYFLVASWMALAGACSLITAAVCLGFGQHSSAIIGSHWSRILLFTNAAGFGTILAALWSKTSFALTMLRISEGWVRSFIYFVIVTVNLVLGASAVIQWVQCWPPEKIWHPSYPGSCLPNRYILTYNTFSSIYSGAMDILLALLPWKVIWKVAVNRKERLGLVVAMSMGVFAGAMSISKLIIIPSIGGPDIINTVNVMIFGVAEGAITIMATSIPILRVLFQYLRTTARNRRLEEDKTSDTAESPRR